MEEKHFTRIKNKQCPICSKHKDMWDRKRNSFYCSKECQEISSSMIIHGLKGMRDNCLKRDNYICRHCNKHFKSSKLDGDHIIPAAIGGNEWDLDNMQTLCKECHIEKTKKDLALIAKHRRHLYSKFKMLYKEIKG